MGEGLRDGGAGGETFAAMSGEEHLACAADIAAYAALVETGRLPLDRARLARSLAAFGWHHNAYAVPLGMGEAQAFAVVRSERDAVLARDAAEAIAARACLCIDAAPGLPQVGNPPLSGSSS